LDRGERPGSSPVGALSVDLSSRGRLLARGEQWVGFGRSRTSPAGLLRRGQPGFEPPVRNRYAEPVGESLREGWPGIWRVGHPTRCCGSPRLGPDAQRPAHSRGPGVATSLESSAGLCVDECSVRSMAGHELLVLASASGVGETETDCHRHDPSERKRCDGAPEGDFGDEAEASTSKNIRGATGSLLGTLR